MRNPLVWGIRRLNHTRRVPSFAGMPIAPALCQSFPRMICVNGRPQCPPMIPSTPDLASSAALMRGAVVGVERAVGMGEPGGCELVAGAAGGKAAAAIAAPRGQALLAIAQDDPRAGSPHQRHGRSGIGTIV